MSDYKTEQGEAAKDICLEEINEQESKLISKFRGTMLSLDIHRHRLTRIDPYDVEEILSIAVAINEFTDDLFSVLKDFQELRKNREAYTPAPSAPASDAGLTPAELSLLKSFRTLNFFGREKVLDYSVDLNATGRYAPIDLDQPFPPET